MELVSNFSFYVIIQGIVIFFAYTHFKTRLDAQDKYLSTYLRAFANHNGDQLPPFLDTTEILEDKEERKPEVYSPRHDPETIMQGKVIDPFD